MELETLDIFIDGENIPTLFESKQFNFVVDTIDSLAPKVSLLEYCIKYKVKLFAMGAAEELTRLKFNIPIYQNLSVYVGKKCPQKTEKIRHRKGLPVVFSSEQVNKKCHHFDRR